MAQQRFVSQRRVAMCSSTQEEILLLAEKRWQESWGLLKKRGEFSRKCRKVCVCVCVYNTKEPKEIEDSETQKRVPKHLLGKKVLGRGLKK